MIALGPKVGSGFHLKIGNRNGPLWSKRQLGEHQPSPSISQTRRPAVDEDRGRENAPQAAIWTAVIGICLYLGFFAGIIFTFVMGPIDSSIRMPVSLNCFLLSRELVANHFF